MSEQTSGGTGPAPIPIPTFGAWQAVRDVTPPLGQPVLVWAGGQPTVGQLDEDGWVLDWEPSPGRFNDPHTWSWCALPAGPDRSPGPAEPADAELLAAVLEVLKLAGPPAGGAPSLIMPSAAGVQTALQDLITARGWWYTMENRAERPEERFSARVHDRKRSPFEGGSGPDVLVRAPSQPLALARALLGALQAEASAPPAPDLNG